MAVTPLTAMLQATAVLVCSTKVMTEELLKCVQPLPVMPTFTTVPDAPAPGETTDTAAAGGVAVAEPVSAATIAEPPGAELAIVSAPPRVVLGVTDVGVKLT